MVEKGDDSREGAKLFGLADWWHISLFDEHVMYAERG